MVTFLIYRIQLKNGKCINMNQFIQKPNHMTQDQFLNLQRNIAILNSDPNSFIGNSPKPREIRQCANSTNLKNSGKES